jgi:hypothetical protein
LGIGGQVGIYTIDIHRWVSVINSKSLLTLDFIQKFHD